MSLDNGITHALEDLLARWWVRDASCGDPDIDSDIFFPERGNPGHHNADQAKAICHACPVEAECLAYALRPGHQEKFGVWGGTTEKERRVIRQQRRASGQNGTISTDREATG